MRDDLFLTIARDIHVQGGRALLVGGCVRDALMGRESGDIDCEVHGLAQEVLLALLLRYGDVDESGARYGVYTLRGAGIDWAMPRLEKRTGPLHRDFSVVLDANLLPERAAARRDFTVNAILRDALTGELIDPFGGLDDLKAGVLRQVPSGQFEEDSLRVLRGAQFAARFGFTIEPNTLCAMAHMPLDSLSAPRVLGETQKALLDAPRPEVFFDVLRQAGALAPWFAPMQDGDAFEKTRRLLPQAAAVRGQARDALSWMAAALTLHVPQGQAMLTRLSLRKSALLYAQRMTRCCAAMQDALADGASVGDTNALLDEAPDAQELALLVRCDALSRGNAQAARFAAERLAAYEAICERPMPTAAMMQAAGVPAGLHMGRALALARRFALAGEPAEAASARAAREILKK